MNSLNNILYSSKSAFLVVFAFVLAGNFAAEAQLFVKENTIFTVDKNLSTKMKVNTFHATVSGSDTLYFVGQSQSLFVRDGKSLPSVRITDASQLDITSPVYVKGNLTIDAGVLVLHHVLKVEGNLKLSKEAAVQNAYFMQLMNQQLMPLDGAPNQNTNSIASAAVLWLDETDGKAMLALFKKQVFTTTNTLYQAMVADVTKPPPQLG